MKARKTRKFGSGCLLLFSLPFAAVGVGMAIWMGCTVLTYLQARSWEEVPARIVRAELRVDNSGDSTTYEAKAEYTYVYADRKYTGTRVSLSSGTDNIGSFQQKIYQQLDEHRRSGQPMPCYVNPGRPSQALLYRDLRWEMIVFQLGFVLGFGGVGFGLLAAGLLGQRKQRSEAARAADYPQQPWLWRKDWADGRIVHSGKKWMLIALIVAAAWNLLSAPLWLVLPGELIDKGNRWALLGLAFPLVGLLLAGWFLFAAIRWRKFGTSVLQMAAVPGVIGGQLAGVIRTSAKVHPDSGFRLTLSCIERVTRGSGDDRHTTKEVLWQQERVVVRDLAEADPALSAIPVLFAIPYECRPCDSSHADDQTSWRLEVRADVPGVDYRAAFEVPVFKTPDSDPKFVPDDSAMAEYLAPAAPRDDLAAAGVIQTATPWGDGQRFLFPRGRNLGNALGGTLFCLIFAAVAVVLRVMGAPILFPIGFGLFGVLLLLFGLNLWLYQSAIDVSPGRVTVRSGWLGLDGGRQIDATDVLELTALQGMRSNQKVYYDLVLVCRNKKRVTFGKGVLGRQVAEGIIRQIEQAMGRAPAGGDQSSAPPDASQ